jgi:hypothetical protein
LVERVEEKGEEEEMKEIEKEEEEEKEIKDLSSESLIVKSEGHNIFLVSRDRFEWIWFDNMRDEPPF